MADCRITHTKKNIHGTLTEVGNPSVPWRWSVPDTLKSIQAGTNTFFTQTGSIRADVFVAQNAAGHQFLKTTADNSLVNNLDSLPSFP